MSSSTKQRRFVLADLNWLVPNPTTQPSAGLTAFRQSHGIGDLFSVYLQFSISDGHTGAWDKAKIYALTEEMEVRLSLSGEVLVVTAGSTPVAEARIVSDGVDMAMTDK